MSIHKIPDTKFLNDILKKTFNLNTFRSGQLEALETLFQQKRLLCIQPTGHGKSLLYQLPSVILPGITVVISPLLALMRDQITQLENRFNIKAASINSDQSIELNKSAEMDARNGKIKILFIAPEKLDHLEYLNFLKSLPISLIVIDEAHCISTWGHDFRSGYRQIIHFVLDIERINSNIHLLALTATANHIIEQDIVQQLSKDHAQIPVMRQSMNRANLMLENIQANGLAEKLSALRQVLKQREGTGLIYCATRENTEMVCRYLQQFNIRVAAYHAGLHTQDKQDIQKAFMDNAYDVITATNALGMGIDKSDLRTIIHFDMPGSIVAYYQEVGRAGRDGLTAQGILLFDEKDKKIQQYFIDSAQPYLTDFDNIMTCIGQNQMSMTLSDIKRQSGLHPTRVGIVLAELIEQGFLVKKLDARRQVYVRVNKKGNIDLSRFERQLAIRQQELTHMLHYGHPLSKVCLMATLRKALGDFEAENCGHCSHCAPSTTKIQYDSAELMDIHTWLNKKTIDIQLGQLSGCAQGMAYLDVKLRSPLAIEFMRQRQREDLSISEPLKALVLSHLSIIKTMGAQGIIALPSNTWAQREVFTQWLASHLQIPCYLNALHWKDLPEARQGECLNNDQRRFNVHEKMGACFEVKISGGPLLLLDDYVGSGATFKEAARALKKEAGCRNKLIPLTIASVKWRLGQRGMV